MRVTVVNDNPEFLQLMQDLLQDANHPAVLIDGDRENALELIEASKPDVLILDLRLGSRALRGLEILRAVRRNGTLAAVPVVVCSADPWAMHEIENELAATQGVTILAKPFAIDELYTILNRVAASAS